MRIAIAAPEDLPIPPTRGGSVQIYLNELTKSLASVSNHEIYLLSPAVLIKKRREQFGTFSGIRHITYRPSQSTGKQRLTYAEWVCREMARIQPDVIQVDNRPLLANRLQTRFPKIPVILNLHSLTFLGPANIAPSRAKSCLRKLHVVVNSDYVRRTLARRFGLARNEWNAHVIYPGVNLSKWRTSEIKSHDKSQPLEVLFVGRVIRQKGVHVLVRAIRQMKQQGVPVRLTIVGRTHPWEQPYYNAVRKSSVGLPIVWKGFVSPQKLPALVKRAHAAVVPSQSVEAFGLVNVEAMAAGVPVVASQVGGIPEVVDDTCGIIVANPSKPSNFARAITHLAQSEAFRVKLARGAKKRASQFTWERAARQFVTLYKQIKQEQ